MKRTLAIILIPLFFILLPILSGCGLKSRPKDDLVKQSVIEEADAEPTDEKAREIIQDSDTERQDYLELENTAQLDDNIPLPEDIEQRMMTLSWNQMRRKSRKIEEERKRKSKKTFTYKIQVDVTNQVVTVFGRTIAENIPSCTPDDLLYWYRCHTPLGTFIMPGQGDGVILPNSAYMPSTGQESRAAFYFIR